MRRNRRAEPIEYTPESLVKRTAFDVGFSDVGIADVQPSAQSDLTFDRWLAAGRHGEMKYLEGGQDKRHDPSILLDGARSVISVAVNYYSESREARNCRDREQGCGVVSVYAHGRDYHEVIADMLRELERRLKELFPRMESVPVVDTQPISERDLAVRAGIAWLGKNTMAISNEYGSWIFLGELLTTLELQSDRPLTSLCGSCTRCMDACPTDALRDPYVLDATKCISYLTIEKRGEIAEEFHKEMGSHLFGCDECQSVCPFNAAPQESDVFGDDTQSPIMDVALRDLAALPDRQFRESTRGSAIARCKAAGMRRNARIVIDNLHSRRPKQ